MGPSGTGKTHAAAAHHRADPARSRHRSCVWGQDLSHARQRARFTRCASAWACCSRTARCSPISTCSRTSRFPLREHTRLPEPLIRTLVLTKLHAVGLRGAAELMPAELSGGMARRVALARAIVMDPELLIYDEPFVGLDPISLGVILRLIRQMNEGLGHHQHRRLARRARARHHRARQLPALGRAASSPPARRRSWLRASSEVVQQFMNGSCRRPGAVPLSGAGLPHAAAAAERR